MNNPSKKDLFGSARLEELTTPLRSGRVNTLIPFSTRLKFSTLVRLKQAMHHLGALEQEFIDAAILVALNQIPESDNPLPVAKQAGLDKLLDKTQGR